MVNKIINSIYTFYKRRVAASFFIWNVKRKARSCGEGLLVFGYTNVNRNTVIGDHASFNGMNIYGNGEVEVGRYFHSGVECMLITSFHNYDGDLIPYDTIDIHKKITIGDFVWFGSRVTVLGGVTIGEGAIIQAGAVVVNNIPKYGIAGGSPAKVFKYRDGEKFEKLKAQGKFLQ